MSLIHSDLYILLMFDLTVFVVLAVLGYVMHKVWVNKP